MIANSNRVAWLDEMRRLAAEGNREFDQLMHVFRALDPPTRSNCVEPSGRTQEGSSAGVRTADAGVSSEAA